MYAVTFDIHPVSLNVSFNQEAILNCSIDIDAYYIEWMYCSESAQDGNDKCKNERQLSTNGCETTIDRETDQTLTRELKQLIIFITDCLYLLNELNNSLVHCQALYDGGKPANSTQARLIFQGQLYTNYSDT